MSMKSKTRPLLAILAALAISSCASQPDFVSCPILPIPPKPHYPVPTRAEIKHLEALARRDPVLFAAMKKIVAKDAMCRARNNSLESIIRGANGAK